VAILVVGLFEDFVLVDHNLHEANIITLRKPGHGVNKILVFWVTFPIKTSLIVCRAVATIRRTVVLGVRTARVLTVGISKDRIWILRLVGLPVNVVDHHHVG